MVDEILPSPPQRFLEGGVARADKKVSRFPVTSLDDDTSAVSLSQGTLESV